MSGRSTWLRWVALVGIVGMLGWSGTPSPTIAQPALIPIPQASRLSQGVLFNYWLAHPDQAPASLQARLRVRLATGASVSAPPSNAEGTQAAALTADRFNKDIYGMPQNEEAVTACRTQPSVVLGGTNDYRGLLGTEQNFTGWHLSTNGGSSVTNEGFLPAIEVTGDTPGLTPTSDPFPSPTPDFFPPYPTPELYKLRLPSGGDPVVAADGKCNLYAGSLNYDRYFSFGGPSAVGVYRTTPATLTKCAGGSDASCWPTRRAVAVARDGHFLDKEWMDVGVSGSAGNVVWVVYTDFNLFGDQSEPLSAIYAVRCSANLQRCTAPILLSGDDRDVQFSDVTIGPDGRTYVTWTEVVQPPGSFTQTFVHKLRVAPAGSTTFARERTVYVEGRPIQFDAFLPANDFRVATYPKHAVQRLPNGTARIFVVWDACRERILDDRVCEAAQVRLSYSDNGGVSWVGPRTLSLGGSNYFPTIAADPNGTMVAIAWYTSRQDEVFGNRQDVELVSLNAESASVAKRQIITPVSNEPEADPYLGGLFIGDYIDVFANAGTAYVHYNANYQRLRFIGAGLPVAQQDNYLTRANLVEQP